MKRDDFGMRIDEIRELATKYSKPDLARMVKMGMLDPQRALMAGMMIDRIAKSAMQPPQTTVAEDVLQPTTAQAQVPQGIMGSPQAPPPSQGVATLPSGLQNMAGGGIVAFADGGEADIPGYADGTLTDSRRDPAMKIDPRVQAKRDRDRYQILAQELRDAQNRMMRGEPGAKADFEALQREMRSVKPARAMGIESLIPSAEAGDVSPPPQVDRPASIAPKGPGSLVPPPKSSMNEAIARKRQEIMAGDTRPPVIQPERYAEKAAELGMTGIPLNPDIGTSPAEESAAPTTFEPNVAPQAEGAPEAPARGIAAPAAIKAEQIPVPVERKFAEEYGDIQEGYKQAGVDVDMYKNMMQELKGKKAGLAQKKEQALGSALMAFGLGLAGARQGQVMQQLGSEGQKALGLYMNSMDKIADNEDKIDILNRQIAMAENNFKRTGADSALAQMRERRNRIDQIEAKNAEMRQRAAEHQATVAANVYHTDVWAKVSGENAATQAAARLAAIASQAGRAGALTQKQRFDIEQQLRIELEPKLREKYKNLGSEEQINKKVNDELRRQIGERISQISAQPSGYGGSAPPQDMFADWTVEGM